MNFKEITAEDLFGKGVTGLPDTPGLSTTDMQAKFDELVKDVMVPKFNALVRELAVLSGVESVTKELENTETSIPTGSAVAKYIEEKGSGNATVEEMTWAEYEALSEEEKMDGTLRVITDRKAGVRFGNVDISDIGDGTVTGAISAINGNLSTLKHGKVTCPYVPTNGYAARTITFDTPMPDANYQTFVQLTRDTEVGGYIAGVSFTTTDKTANGFKCSISTLEEIGENKYYLDWIVL